MVVDRELQQKFATLQQTHAPAPGMKPPKTAASSLGLNSPSPPPPPARTFTASSVMMDAKHPRKTQMKKSTSSDVGWKDDTSSSPRHTPSSSATPDAQSPSPESTTSTDDSGGYSHLRRSTSPEAMRNDSWRLAAMNVTLRRNQDPSSATSSEYSTLNLSREALLLRSGVTLRRSIMSQSSLSPLEQFARQSGYSVDESGSGSGSQTDEEDSLEPVNK